SGPANLHPLAIYTSSLTSPITRTTLDKLVIWVQDFSSLSKQANATTACIGIRDSCQKRRGSTSHGLGIPADINFRKQWFSAIAVQVSTKLGRGGENEAENTKVCRVGEFRLSDRVRCNASYGSRASSQRKHSGQNL